MKEGHNRICVVDGGFFAVHEYIRRIQKMDWLVDHNEDDCEGMNEENELIEIIDYPHHHH